MMSSASPGCPAHQQPPSSASEEAQQRPQQPNEPWSSKQQDMPALAGSGISPQGSAQPLQVQVPPPPRTHEPAPTGRSQRRPAPVCQVDGCGEDLSDEKYKVYHRRNRICDEHFKCLICVHKGRNMRYCQQCHKFHDIDAFDAGKHSCRAKLQKRAGKAGRAAEAAAAEALEAAKAGRRRVWPGPGNIGSHDLGMNAFGMGSMNMMASSDYDAQTRAMDIDPAGLARTPGGLAARMLGLGTNLGTGLALPGSASLSSLQQGQAGPWRSLQMQVPSGPTGAWATSTPAGLLAGEGQQPQTYLLTSTGQLTGQGAGRLNQSGANWNQGAIGGSQQRHATFEIMGGQVSLDSGVGLMGGEQLQRLAAHSEVGEITADELWQLQHQRQQQQQLLLQRQWQMEQDEGLALQLQLRQQQQQQQQQQVRQQSELLLQSFDAGLSAAARQEGNLRGMLGQLQQQLQQQQQGIFVSTSGTGMLHPGSSTAAASLAPSVFQVQVQGQLTGGPRAQNLGLVAGGTSTEFLMASIEAEANMAAARGEAHAVGGPILGSLRAKVKEEMMMGGADGMGGSWAEGELDRLSRERQRLYGSQEQPASMQVAGAGRNAPASPTSQLLQPKTSAPSPPVAGSAAAGPSQQPQFGLTRGLSEPTQLTLAPRYVGQQQPLTPGAGHYLRESAMSAPGMHIGSSGALHSLGLGSSMQQWEMPVHSISGAGFNMASATATAAPLAGGVHGHASHAPVAEAGAAPGYRVSDSLSQLMAAGFASAWQPMQPQHGDDGK